MADETTFIDEESGAKFCAVLIPAKVQLFRLEAGEGKVEHAVGTVEAEQLKADPPIQSKNLFSEEVLHAGAAPWARKTAKALLGL